MMAAYDPSGEIELALDPNAVPVLSASAENLQIDKLLSAPLPTYDASVPGSFIWTKLAFWMCRRVSSVQFRTTSSTTLVPQSTRGSGAMCCGWHTNGLMDPLAIFLQHPKEFVVGARHDLVTRPLLGWWTRKLAVQPVVRKAELLRGGCTEEEAMHLNGRSLLALANGIAHGFGCVLFPEGTSHSLSHMVRFKTGPARTVLAAAALAKANDLPLPHMVPVGLHFRRRELFRTDQYIEFGDPIQLTDDMLPDEMVAAVSEGGWIEPPAETVHHLRDELQARLPPMTPEAASWPEHRAVHLTAHAEALAAGRRLTSWQDEVHAAREVRDTWPGRARTFPPEPITGARFEQASEAAELLEMHGLDGRDLGSGGRVLRKASWGRLPSALLSITVFLALLPFAVTSLGFQIALGRLLGDSTDEGLDARTSYQFLAAFFGSLLIWPLIAALWTGIVWFVQDDLATVMGWSGGWLELSGGSPVAGLALVYVLLFPVFWASGKSFAAAWDVWVDSRKAWTRFRFPSEEKARLARLVNELTS